MITRTQTIRIGEYLGPIDFDYDFRKHFDSCGCSAKTRDSDCENQIEMLKRFTTETVGNEHLYDVQIYEYWHPLLQVGMYDGWPYWKPTPAVMYIGPLSSPEWGFWYDIRNWRRRDSVKNRSMLY